MVGVQAEQHLQDGDDERKREQRQERGQQVEQDVQHDIFLVGRHKPLQQFPKTFHSRKGTIKFLVFGFLVGSFTI